MSSSKGGVLIAGIILMSLGVGLLAFPSSGLTVGQGSYTETVTEYRTATTSIYATKTQVVTIPITTTAVVNNQITTTVSSEPSTTTITSPVTSTIASNPSTTTFTTTIQGPTTTLTTVTGTTTTAAQIVSQPGWVVRLSLRDTGVYVLVFNPDVLKWKWVDVEIGTSETVRNAKLINVEGGQGSTVIPLSGAYLGQYLYVWIRAYNNYERIGLPELVYVSANQRVESYQYGWTPYSVFGISFTGTDIYKYAFIASGAVLIVFSVRKK